MTQTLNAPPPPALAGLPYCSSYGKLITPAPAEDVVSTSARERCLSHLHSVLVSPERNCAILTGRPGVGKTTLLRELAALIGRKAPGEPLAGCLIVEIDMNRLRASVGDKIEKIVTALWDEARRSGNVIFFIDEAHKLASGGADSLGNMLKPLVTSGDVPTVLATTTDEYRQYIEGDGALKRRFEEVAVPEPDRASMLKILRGKARSFGARLEVSAAPALLERVPDIAGMYMGDLAEPDRSLKLLERAFTLASLRPGKGGAEEGDLLEAAGLLANMPSPAARPLRTCKEAAVKLAELVAGQEEAAARVAEFLVCDGAGLYPPKGPRGVFLFLGPRGCGKRTLAEAASELLGAPPSQAVRIALSPSMTAARLAGISPSMPGLLAEPVRKKPRSVVIVDVHEDAHPDGAEALARAVTEGAIKDWAGRDVSLAGTVFFFRLSSPEGTGEGRGIGFGSASPHGTAPSSRLASLARRLLPRELHFLAHRVTPFSTLDREALRQVFAMKHERGLQAFAAKRGLTLNVEDDGLEALLDRALAAGEGGASLERAVEELHPLLAETANFAPPGGRIRITAEGGILKAEAAGGRTGRKKPDLAA
ncbi:MAG: AAA family ATPase [Aminivibrio sp.]|jgi:ATP-dependent Clp protease ATP-binding subunit ClpC|nr:ATP-dependent Clp protease ATP-binding subunit [Synergistaceae bacterium]